MRHSSLTFCIIGELQLNGANVFSNTFKENIVSELLIEVHLEVLKPVSDSEELNRPQLCTFATVASFQHFLNVIGNVSLKSLFFLLL